MNVDIVNGVFELSLGLLQWRNVWQLWKDKQVKGVYWPMWAFVSLWGFWNLIYYPSLSQWCSFSGGVVLMIGNTIWTAMAAFYATRCK